MSQNQPFDVFWGGLLLNSCIPLELRGNKCSHACGYCFDRLHNRKPVVNAKQAFNLLMDFWNRESPAAKLLKLGYPVLASNHTDPLSANNAEIYIPFVEALESLNIPYSIQSRGGPREDELLDIISKPIVWYMSIECGDPDIARRISKGPLPEQRLALIEKLTARGHKVAVGINPLNPTFLPDPSPLISAIADLGVKSVWIHNLHLSHGQVKNMTQLEKESIGELAISQALRPANHPEVAEHYEATRYMAAQVGLNVYNNQQKERSDYFNIYDEIYPVRYPLMQDWVNHCHDTLKHNDLIYWSDFRNWFTPRLPSFSAEEFPGREHINALVHPSVQGQCRDLDGGYMPRRMPYEQLLWFLWHYKQTILSPVNVDCFAWAAISGKDKNSWTRYVDDSQNPILVFKPKGTKGSAYVERRI